MTLQEKIKVNTIGLLNSFTSLDQTKIEFKPAENVWTILECVEHIYLIDAAVLKVINTPISEKVENDKSEIFGSDKLNHILVTKRADLKVPAPDIVVPIGRFKTVKEATENINTITEKIIFHLNVNDISKEVHTIKHPRLGEMTKVDWIHFMIAHTNRHILQIEEVKKLL